MSEQWSEVGRLSNGTGSSSPGTDSLPTSNRGLPQPVMEAVEAGFAIVPGSLSKMPKKQWKRWRTEPQTPEQREDLGHGSVWGLILDGHDIVVLDFDGPEGQETMKKLGLLPHVKTPGGGHVYVHGPGYYVNNSAKKFSQYPGMDIRGNGGIAWFHGRSNKGKYEPVAGAWPPEPDELPPELVAELFPLPQEAGAMAPAGEWSGEGDGDRMAVRFVRRKAQEIEDAVAGTSNAVTNKAGYVVGGLVASGQVSESFAYGVLANAAWNRKVGDGDTVLRAAMTSGAEKPWKIEPVEDDIDAAVYDLFKRGDIPEPIPFPIGVYPAPLDEFIRQGSDSVSCPPDYFAAGLLPILGIGLGGYITLQVTETWHESAGTYVMMVGPPGARKTPALGMLMRPVWDSERTIEDGAIEEAGEDWKEIKPDQIVVDDATIEAMFGVLEHNKRGVIMVSDELRGWVNGMGQYKNGSNRDRQHWLSIWARHPIKINRKTSRDHSVRHPFVPVLGGIQPEPLEELMYSHDDGLLPRLLMAQGEYVTPVLKRGAVSQEVITGYHELWTRMQGRGVVPRTVEFTEAGYKAFEAWANEHYKTLRKVSPALQGAWSKMDAQCARISLILAETWEQDAVDEDTVDRAVAMVRYFQGQAGTLGTGSVSSSDWEKQQARRLTVVAQYVIQHPGASKADIMGLADWAKDWRYVSRLLEPLQEMGIWDG